MTDDNISVNCLWVLLIDAVPEQSARPRGRPAANAAHAIDEAALLGRVFRAFAERGYDGVTLRDLAKQLGISHNLLNVRFGRKGELWKSAVDWRLAQAAVPVVAAFDLEGDPEARLRKLVHLFCRWATENSDVVALTHFEGGCEGWRLDHIVRHFILPFKERLDALIGEVAAVRPVSPISTSALMALLVQGVGFFFGAVALQRRLGAGAEVESANAPERASLMADFLLAGLLPRPSPG